MLSSGDRRLLDGWTSRRRVKDQPSCNNLRTIASHMRARGTSEASKTTVNPSSSCNLSTLMIQREERSPSRLEFLSSPLDQVECRSVGCRGGYLTDGRYCRLLDFVSPSSIYVRIIQQYSLLIVSSCFRATNIVSQLYLVARKPG